MRHVAVVIAVAVTAMMAIIGVCDATQPRQDKRCAGHDATVFDPAWHQALADELVYLLRWDQRVPLLVPNSHLSDLLVSRCTHLFQRWSGKCVSTGGNAYPTDLV